MRWEAAWGGGSCWSWAPTGVVAHEDFGREQQRLGRVTLCPGACCSGGNGGLGNVSLLLLTSIIHEWSSLTILDYIDHP